MNLTIATPSSPNTMTTTTASHSIVTTLSPSLDGTTTSPPSNVMTTVAPSIDEGPLRMDIALDADFANITFSADVTKEDIWFGVGFHANKMADFPYAIIIFGDGTVAERKLGNHVQGTLLTSMITVVSNSVNNNGRRIVVMKRARTGLTSDHYTFTNEETIDCIYAIGYTKVFAYHKNFGVNMKVEVTQQPTPSTTTSTTTLYPKIPQGRVKVKLTLSYADNGNNTSPTVEDFQSPVMQAAIKADLSLLLNIPENKVIILAIYECPGVCILWCLWKAQI